MASFLHAGLHPDLFFYMYRLRPRARVCCELHCRYVVLGDGFDQAHHAAAVACLLLLDGANPNQQIKPFLAA
jgi:hypothetical protein